MKKTLCFILAAMMLLVAFTACGNGNGDTTTAADTTAAVADNTTAAADETTAAAVDPNAKDEGVLNYAAFIATDAGKEVVVEAFLQAKYAYASAYGNTSLYLADGDGAYYVYRYSCSQEVYDALTVGTKYKITGTKAEYAGEVEISDVTALEAVGTDTYTADILDVTSKLAAEDLNKDMNKYVAVKGAEVVASKKGEEDCAFLYKYNGAGAQGDDLYFNVKVGDKTYTFVIETDFCAATSDVYKAGEALKIGDKIDIEGYLYWYNGAQIQVTKISAAK